MLVRYGAITLGFLLAAAIAGIPLDRLAFVLGAFSVGIGFGLQTIVNNFVSGLILMFERPIQIGDTVDVGGLVGRVRHIGVRASRLETSDGAEAIVPNGELVSGRIINWTLTSRNRRIEIQVSVVRDTDPERALAVLRDAVSGTPDVLTDPAPSSLLRGFGTGTLDLSLFFWTAKFEEWTRVRSDVTVRVNQALRDAGIELASEPPPVS
jgi:small-conductance mechanosensitive channel